MILSKVDKDVTDLRNSVDMLVEIVVRQNSVLMSLQRRLLECERYRLKLETKKIDELLTTRFRDHHDENRDVS